MRGYASLDMSPTRPRLRCRRHLATRPLRVTGKLIDRSCDEFWSICAAARHSICGLSPTRYAALLAARYVPQGGTLWTDHITEKFIDLKQIAFYKIYICAGLSISWRQRRGGCRRLLAIRPLRMSLSLKVYFRAGLSISWRRWRTCAAIGLNRGFAVSKTTGGKE